MSAVCAAFGVFGAAADCVGACAARADSFALFSIGDAGTSRRACNAPGRGAVAEPDGVAFSPAVDVFDCVARDACALATSVTACGVSNAIWTGTRV